MKMTIGKNNRTFIAYVCSIGAGIAEVSFYEVIRPSWKIFRTTFFPVYRSAFWVSDYESISLGVSACLDEGFEIERRENELAEKWEKFAKTIDKSNNL